MGPATKAILFGTIAVFLLQVIVDRASGGLFTYLFGLTCSGFRPGGAWQLVTYTFLHGGVWHLVLNMLALVVMGTEMERAMGSLRFTALYVVSGIVGGLGWLLLSCSGAGVCVGASGSVFGVIGAFAALFPRRQITLLLLFVLPVTMRAGLLALLLGLVTILSLIAGDGNVAHAAHLGGGIAGYLYGRRFASGMRAGRSRSRFVRFPGHWLTRPHPETENEPPDPDDVNRVLDKVLREGIGSLSAEEREILDRASRAGQN